MTDLRTAARQALDWLDREQPFSIDDAYRVEERFRRTLRAALAEPEERNFCPRCGKRTNDIHTCTPPEDADVHR